MINWINSAGGPFIFCDIRTALLWNANYRSSIASEQTDYDRACNTSKYLDVLNISQAQVLIIGDEPLPSAVVHESDGFSIVRWISCQGKSMAEDVLKNIPVQLPLLEDPVEFRLRVGNCVLFDAACLLGEKNQVEIFLEPGNYTVATELFKSVGYFEFLIHRLKKF